MTRLMYGTIVMDTRVTTPMRKIMSLSLIDIKQ